MRAVTTTGDRLSGSATNGVAYSLLSAHRYRTEDDSAVRAVHQSSPPWARNQSSCSAKRCSVTSAGVLYVWFLPELSTAMDRSRDAGTHRCDVNCPTRSSAPGDISAIHSPPSEPKFFCGAK